MRLRPWLVLLGALSGCELFAQPSDGGDDDDDDSGYQTPASVPDEMDCRPLYETPAPGAEGQASCVTADLTCGVTTLGTIEGGSDVFSNESGMAWEWCSGHSTGEQLAGPERVYKLTVPDGTTYVSARLASCEKLQLLWYQTGNACPSERVTCNYVTVDGAFDQDEDILLGDSGVIWFVVEGIEGTTGNFQLTVDCGGP